jgi:hypothetical protein
MRMQEVTEIIRDGIFELCRNPEIGYKESIPPAYVVWARNCKRLWSPEIDSEESISPTYVAWRASTTNMVSYLPARLRIDTWSPQKIYKYRLWRAGTKTLFLLVS